MLNQNFNPEECWADRDYKKWVVVLGNGKKRDRKIVGSATVEGALLTARHHTHLKGRISASARLATPHDLGAVKSEAAR